MKRVMHLTFVLVMALSFVYAQPKTGREKIRLNQLGFYPHAPKIAVIADERATDFYLVAEGQKRKVYSGKLTETRRYDYSPVKTRVADFSQFTQTGKFILIVPGVGESYPFQIRSHIHRGLAHASLKNYYYQRMSMPLHERYAGKWHRPAGHPDNNVLIHASAATALRPEGFEISCPRGWYDAGDYNKYIVNSGITMATLFSAYEDFPAYYEATEVNIPESGNGIPDILDEALWNLRWMLTMQDPEDGGVYHKLTNAVFDGMVMPHEATSPRYVVQKSTAATLNFAAVAAQAARIFKRFDATLPGLADSCLTASVSAYAWAQRHPHAVYNQEEMNKKYDPDIVTGAYGDRNLSDEFAWAASELYVTTRDAQYLKVNDILADGDALPSWNQVKLLGYYTLVRHAARVDSEVAGNVKKRVLAFAENLLSGVEQQPYMTVMGKTSKDFVWGSSAVAANQGVALVQAYRITGEKRFINAALANLDYLLGRNGTGYSFVTGFGSKTPMHPHHRVSEADGIAEPVPGMLSGGPNPGRQDKCDTYTSSIPNEAFTDDVCSYASNEVAINWNAPLVYLAGAIEALQDEAGYVLRKHD